jgi:hypothetical protein
MEALQFEMLIVFQVVNAVQLLISTIQNKNICVLLLASFKVLP